MSIHDNLNQAFDLIVPEEKQLPVEVSEIKSTILAAHRDADVSKARQTLVGLIDSSTDLLNTALQLARESESPRAIEVATSLIKTIAEVSIDVMQIHQSKTEGSKSETPQQATQNNIYVGTTADLANLIKDVRSDI